VKNNCKWAINEYALEPSGDGGKINGVRDDGPRAIWTPK
jgi:hypothetical protein